MKIQIEIPNNWLDSEKLDNLSFITRTLKESIYTMLLDYGFNEAMKTIEFPKIKIDQKELKKRVMDAMVEKALENL